MSELLLGYDVREMCFDMDELWPPERRTTYLLKPTADKPLSADTLVWPSIFDIGQGADWFADARKRAGLSESSHLPTWTGRNMDLWEDRNEMLKLLKTQPGASSCESMIVAITLAENSGGSPIEPPYPLGPFAAGAEWPILGYDVADSFLLSGLSNCGYSKEEIDTRSVVWAGLLNPHHLFTHPEDANAFRRYTDERVPEHSPFHVFGLWRSQCE